MNMSHCCYCRVIGVLEAVNKSGSSAFTSEDEEVFQTFALFCGHIVHSSNMIKELRKMKNQGEVCVSVCVCARAHV